jgi:hypothetical protein
MGHPYIVYIQYSSIVIFIVEAFLDDLINAEVEHSEDGTLCKNKK